MSQKQTPSDPERAYGRPINTSKNINESADKLRLSTKLVRGTDTRDQETIKVDVRGDDPAKTVDKLNRTLRLLEKTATFARSIDPEARDDGE